MWLALTRAQPTQAAGVVSECSQQGLAAAMPSGSGDITFSCGPATIAITVPAGLSVKTGHYFKIDGGNLITLTGLGANRLFNVQSGCALTLTNIILSDGSADNSNNTYFPNQGGALLNTGGRLVLEHVTVRDSQSTYSGGAIEDSGGTTMLTDSLIEGNQSDYGGGLDSIGTLTLVNSTVRANHAITDHGGGLDVGGTVMVTGSQIINNTANGSSGAGGGV